MHWEGVERWHGQGVGVMLHADMEDKTYTFQIRVTSYNFTVNHQSFTVSRIINEIECVPAPDFDDNVSRMCIMMFLYWHRNDDDENIPFHYMKSSTRSYFVLKCCIHILKTDCFRYVMAMMMTISQSQARRRKDCIRQWRLWGIKEYWKGASS